MSFLKKLFGSQKLDPQRSSQPIISSYSREGVRAQYKSREYFDNKFAFIENRLAYDLEFYQKLINEKGEYFDKYKPSEFVIGQDYEMLFDAGYSRGDSITSIKSFFEKAFYHFIRSWNKEDDIYNQALSILSIGVLLQVDLAYFEQTFDLFKREGYNDYLLDYLLKSKLENISPTPTLIFKNDVALDSLAAITKLPQATAQEKLSYFLENQWYTRQNLEDMYNAHLLDDKYLGYWSYEAAAITKIMGLDDSSYKDNQFYPYDLVHWQ